MRYLKEIYTIQLRISLLAISLGFLFLGFLLTKPTYYTYIHSPGYDKLYEQVYSPNNKGVYVTSKLGELWWVVGVGLESIKLRREGEMYSSSYYFKSWDEFEHDFPDFTYVMPKKVAKK